MQNLAIFGAGQIGKQTKKNGIRQWSGRGSLLS